MDAFKYLAETTPWQNRAYAKACVCNSMSEKSKIVTFVNTVFSVLGLSSSTMYMIKDSNNFGTYVQYMFASAPFIKLIHALLLENFIQHFISSYSFHIIFYHIISFFISISSSSFSGAEVNL